MNRRLQQQLARFERSLGPERVAAIRRNAAKPEVQAAYRRSQALADADAAGIVGEVHLSLTGYDAGRRLCGVSGGRAVHYSYWNGKRDGICPACLVEADAVEAEERA